MMPFFYAEFPNQEEVLPLYVSYVGSHEQQKIERPSGHPFHQLFFSRSGSGVFQIEGRKEMVMTPGTVLIMPANVPHTYFPEHEGEDWELGFVAFSGQIAATMLEQMKELTSSCLAVSNAEVLWDQLVSLWQLVSLNEGDAFWESSKRIYNMLLMIAEGMWRGKIEPRVSFAYTQPGNVALDTSLKLMHDRYNEKLSLGMIAKASGYSIQHFHRLFVASYGVTPQRYLVQLRMRRAVQLLAEFPDMAVEQIAHQLGMETSYFIRIFKRTYGVTPKRYIRTK